MPLLEDRTRNIIDGTYVNAPDLHNVQPSRNIGLRNFNNGVLVHNWFEERTPVRIWFFKNNIFYFFNSPNFRLLYYTLFFSSFKRKNILKTQRIHSTTSRFRTQNRT